MSSTRTRAAWLLGAALLAPSLALQAQQPAPPLQPTSTAAAAKTAFRTALFETQNVAPDRARAQLEAALAADPQFGLAQVYQNVLAVGMTPAAREAAIAQRLGTMGTATPAEVLLSLYWRETAAGRGAAAVPIIKAAADLVPGDAEIAYIYTNTQNAGKTATEQVAMLRRFLERFPNHAAAHNQLAYTLWRVGDREAALAAVQQYAKLAPEHPNAHDSYADILLLLGRGADAIPHVEREIELDPNFGGAHAKLGAIHLTSGKVSEARSLFATALSKANTPAATIAAMYWQATVHVYAGDAKAAVRELARIAETAKAADLPGAVALAHDRAAVIDAYIGNRKAVPAHLAAAEAAAVSQVQKATHQAHAAVALSRIGKAEEARSALTQFAATGDDAEGVAGTEAIIALDRKDYPAAEAALAKVTTSDPLSKALRAELLLRTGHKAEGETLRKEVLSSSVKQDGNPGLEFLYLLARVRAGSL